MSWIFTPKKQLTVVTRGPGSLSLLNWDNPRNANAQEAVIGSVATTNAGLTRWVVSFSLDYLQYALKWEGEGEAVYQIGKGLERKPVGRNWTSATTIRWGASAATTQDVSARASRAFPRDETTIWIIPDTL
ncbi:mucin-binding lectin 1 [Coprinopsis sp. MPI-PUGE-AT-0042]|nr:mucin-binding lectin 1 [Coprinopsis sp. MPI-PUGE-AT-0042]